MSLHCMHAGYPHNIYCDDYVAMAPLLPYHLNNFDDPFAENNYGMHSRHFEVGVLDWFSKLWEIEQDEYWGYVTHCGTEGNLHGILLGSVRSYYLSFIFIFSRNKTSKNKVSHK